MKLNVLLALTDQLASVFKGNVKDFLKFFKDKQGAFRGEKKTYEPRSGTIDEPTKRGTTLIVSTVKEKFDWFVANQTPYLDALFAQERTNASGIAKTRLVVGDTDFGELTSLELLRLKSILESAELKDMYASIPVRSDAEIWDESTHEDYSGRTGIFQTPRISAVSKSTLKEPYILDDPNVARLGAAAVNTYKPTMATRDTVIELGDYTLQKFTGEYSHRQRATILKRISDLHTAVVAALKVANDVEAVTSPLTGAVIFGYLHS